MRCLCLVMQPPLAKLLQVKPLSWQRKLNNLLNESSGTKSTAPLFTHSSALRLSTRQWEEMRHRGSPRIICVRSGHLAGEKKCWQWCAGGRDWIGDDSYRKQHCWESSHMRDWISAHWPELRSGRRPSFWLVPVSKHTPCFRSGPKINCYWGASENKCFHICGPCVCARERRSEWERRSLWICACVHSPGQATQQRHVIEEIKPGLIAVLG